MFQSAQTTSRPIIWRILDDKPGHQNQVIGLTDALERQTEVSCCDVRVAEGLRGLRCFLPGRIEKYQAFPAPDLLIGAGHATHFPLIALRRRFGGRTIVLMKPSVPMSAFDLCLVPSVHNLRSVGSNVLMTEGALNRVVPSGQLSEQFGIALIGGPSSHFRWSDQEIIHQLSHVLSSDPGIHWTIATSRRTPESFLKEWEAACLPGEMVPWQQTSRDWVPEMLRKVARVWVSTDSVSMIYEAVTAGTEVGVLELSLKSRSRVTRSVEQLISSGTVIGWSTWFAGGRLSGARIPLREADRCAELVIQRFLSAPQVLRRAV